MDENNVRLYTTKNYEILICFNMYEITEIFLRKSRIHTLIAKFKHINSFKKRGIPKIYAKYPISFYNFQFLADNQCKTFNQGTKQRDFFTTALIF